MYLICDARHVAVGEAKGGAGQGGPEGLHIRAGRQCMRWAAHAPAQTPQRAAAPAQVRAHAAGHSLTKLQLIAMQLTLCNHDYFFFQCLHHSTSGKGCTPAYSRRLCNIID